MRLYLRGGVSLMKHVIFVCLGNICRSPAAEAYFKALCGAKGALEAFDISSRGIDSYHVGEAADPRMREAAHARGVEIEGVAELLSTEEMSAADYILVATADIAKHLKERQPACASKIHLISHWSVRFKEQDIPDPYYSETQSFNYVMDMLEECLEAFYEHEKSK